MHEKKYKRSKEDLDTKYYTAVCKLITEFAKDQIDFLQHAEKTRYELAYSQLLQQLRLNEIKAPLALKHQEQHLKSVVEHTMKNIMAKLEPFM